jgi:hypothetical protein
VAAAIAVPRPACRGCLTSAGDEAEETGDPPRRSNAVRKFTKEFQMHTITRIAAAAASTLALLGIAQAQTTAPVPGNDSSPQSAQEMTSPSNATATATDPSAAAPADSPTLTRVTPENTPASRGAVRDAAAAMNRQDALPHGELSLPQHAEAPDGSFQRKF